jgi:hypothetical protein
VLQRKGMWKQFGPIFGRRLTLHLSAGQAAAQTQMLHSWQKPLSHLDVQLRCSIHLAQTLMLLFLFDSSLHSICIALCWAQVKLG